ncbi:hypothetical protein RA21_11830, partial [Leisingera sp. ANG-DT]
CAVLYHLLQPAGNCEGGRADIPVRKMRGNTPGSGCQIRLCRARGRGLTVSSEYGGLRVLGPGGFSGVLYRGGGWLGFAFIWGAWRGFRKRHVEISATAKVNENKVVDLPRRFT